MLISLLFAEFDIHKGPIVSYAYPVTLETAKKKQFEKQVDFFKDLIIPTTEICFKSCVLEFEDHDIISYPIEIKNEIYERAKVVYNCCFVVSHDVRETGTKNNVAGLYSVSL